MSACGTCEDDYIDRLASKDAEIESLRRRLQDGSPVVEGTIQHMAMEIAALKKERDELKQNIRDMNEYMHKRIEAALAKLGADKTGDAE